MGSVTLKHSIDGRLRLKLDSVKNSKSTAMAVEASVSQNGAVMDCKANPVTGSVVITYKPEMANEETFLRLLKDEGYYTGKLKRQEQPSQNHDDFHRGVAKILLTKAVEIAAERAILALL